MNIIVSILDVLIVYINLGDTDARIYHAFHSGKLVISSTLLVAVKMKQYVSYVLFVGLQYGLKK